MTAHEGDPAWPAVFGDVRTRLEADLADVYGLHAVRLVPKAVHRRPFSHVVRVEVSAPETGRVADVYVKRFTQKADLSVAAMQARVAHEHDVTARVHGHFATCADLGAIRPLLFYPDALTLATEAAPGVTLLDLLRRRAAWFPSDAAQDALRETLVTTGRWIARLHAVDTSEARVPFDTLRAYLDVRLVRLVEAGGRRSFSERDRSAVLAHADRLGQAMAPSDLREVFVHADLSPGNVLVDGRRVVVLDFAMAHRGTRLQDVTRLHVQLDLLCAKPQFRRAVIARLQAALRHGFDPTLTVNDPLFRLQTIIHRINNLATLTVRPGTGPSALYDAYVSRLHRSWLARELATPIEPATGKGTTA